MTSRWQKGLRVTGGWVLLAGLVACAGPVQRADQYMAQDEWMKAVLEYRKATAANPKDIELRSRLRQTEMKAADLYYQRGSQLLDQENLDGAMLQFQQGLLAMPDHAKLQQAMGQVLARKEAGALLAQARDAAEAGRRDEAARKLRKILELYPEHKGAAQLLQEIQKQAEEEGADRLVLGSSTPITINFRQTELRTGFEFIAKSFGIDVIFDESIKSTPVTLFAKDVTFEQAINLMLATTRTFYKKVGPNTILIAPDTREKRGQYEDHIVRTYQLNSIRAKDMADILKGLITIKKLIVNEQLNTLVLRDTLDVLRLAERIIEANDRKPAELILDVELLEVNRAKADKLGLDLGSYSVAAGVPSTATITVGGSIRQQIRSSATLSLPTVTFRLYKQDVDAKILANPKIRVLNGKSAKIHIGDRVPLRAATIVDATGQTRSTYDYKDIGIRLTVEPTINFDNSSVVKLGLEVSALGENLGTANEPAFKIGTRNAETYMLLRDGETAILGGLIRDEERNTRVRVPLLGDIPVLGTLFTSYDDSGGRTDVLLTITPRIVRGWELPEPKNRFIYSGTETSYQDQPVFQGVSGARRAPAPTPAPAATAPVAGAPGQPAAAVATAAVNGPLVLTFSEPSYLPQSGDEFEVLLVAQNLADIPSIPIEILFNSQALEFVRAEAAGDFKAQGFNAQPDATRGVISLQLDYDKASPPRGNGAVARLVLRGKRPGLSYLVYRAQSLQNTAGETIAAQVRAVRVLVK